MGVPEQNKEVFNKQEITEGLDKISSEVMGAVIKIFKNIDTKKYALEREELLNKIRKIIVNNREEKFGIKE